MADLTALGIDAQHALAFCAVSVAAATVFWFMSACNDRCWEFFEDTDGRRSMARLLCFMSFFPSSYVVMISKNEGTLGWYVGGYVLGYVGGKGCDAYVRKAEALAQGKQPLPANVTINQPEKVNMAATDKEVK